MRQTFVGLFSLLVLFSLSFCSGKKDETKAGEAKTAEIQAVNPLLGKWELVKFFQGEEEVETPAITTVYKADGTYESSGIMTETGKWEKTEKTIVVTADSGMNQGQKIVSDIVEFTAEKMTLTGEINGQKMKAIWKKAQ